MRIVRQDEIRANADRSITRGRIKRRATTTGFRHGGEGRERLAAARNKTVLTGPSWTKPPVLSWQTVSEPSWFNSEIERTGKNYVLGPEEGGMKKMALTKAGGRGRKNLETSDASLRFIETTMVQASGGSSS